LSLPHVFLGDREHPARAAGWIEQGPDDARGPEHLVVLVQQEVNHQTDHFARREVLARSLVGELVELAEELLVDVTHLDVRDRVRVEVDINHLGEDVVEQPGPVQPADLGVEVELLEDVARVGIELVDPGPEVIGHLARVRQDAPQAERRRVVGLGP
jgi:hypothetical protein